MEKRTILAIALSFLVIFFWSRFVYKPEVAPPAAQVQTVVAEKRSFPADTIVAKAQAAQINQEEKRVDYKLPGINFGVIEPLGAVKDITFAEYHKYVFELNKGLFIFDGSLVLVNKSNLSNGFAYTYANQTYQISRALTYSNSNYCMDLEIKITNLSSAQIAVDLPIVLGQFDLEQKSGSAPRFQDMMISENGKVSHPNIKKPAVFNDIKFIGMRDQYFCAIIQPESTGYSAFVDKVSDKVYNTGILAKGLVLAPGSTLVQQFKVYLGPQESDIINKTNSNWSAIVHFGAFDLVAQVILGLLKFLFIVVKNWGMAIVLLSIAIYLILFPLTVAQMKSMKEMQLLQPKMEKLRTTYASDARKLNEETMKLYKEHKVNPLAGCLPMLLQIPVFISLYQVLSRSISLRGAEFLWIKDLSQPDRLFKFPSTIPFIGDYFNILPILMAAGMLIQQKLSSVSSGGVSAEQQKIMMIVFPIMFGVMFYNVPAGLVLYWFLNSTLMLVYQIKVMKSK